MFSQCIQEYSGRAPGNTALHYFELDTLVSLPAFFSFFRRPTALMGQ